MPGPDPKVSDKQILQLVALSPDPIVTAGELTEQIDMTQQGVNKRLKSLVDAGYLESRKVGGAARVYWITPSGRKIAATTDLDYRSGSQ